MDIKVLNMENFQEEVFHSSWKNEEELVKMKGFMQKNP